MKENSNSNSPKYAIKITILTAGPYQNGCVVQYNEILHTARLPPAAT